MNENRVDWHAGDERPEEMGEEHEKKKHADAIAVLLAQVPSMPEQLPASSQWIESGERKTDPRGIF